MEGEDNKIAGKAGNSTVRALREVCARLPHLAGLAAVVEIRITEHTDTAAVTPSGLMVVNPVFFSSLSEEEATFVMAHELMHLALEHHERAQGSELERVNIAGDYIINDLLALELGSSGPEGILQWAGARDFSVEQMLIEMRKQDAANGGTIGQAFDEAAQATAKTPIEDLVDSETERRWFPKDTSEQRRGRRRRVREKVKEINPLRKAVDRLNDLAKSGRSGQDRWAYRSARDRINARDTDYLPPWELALEESLDQTLPPVRSYARASRRNLADDPRIVRPGRVPQSHWKLTIILDTSGSMSWALGKILGVIANFCTVRAIPTVRILQCDTAVTVDETVNAETLASYEIKGYGGSDMSPAMERLDHEVELSAAVVITDGYIAYPRAVNYQVIWAIVEGCRFNPPYGTVVEMRS